jgi:hypothetical protein
MTMGMQTREPIRRKILVFRLVYRSFDRGLSAGPVRAGIVLQLATFLLSLSSMPPRMPAFSMG